MSLSREKTRCSTRMTIATAVGQSNRLPDPGSADSRKRSQSGHAETDDRRRGCAGPKPISIRCSPRRAALCNRSLRTRTVERRLKAASVTTDTRHEPSAAQQRQRSSLPKSDCRRLARSGGANHESDGIRSGKTTAGSMPLIVASFLLYTKTNTHPNKRGNVFPHLSESPGSDRLQRPV